VQNADACVMEDCSEVGAGNWKGPFADGGEVEWRNSKLVEGSRPESLPGWHVSDTGEV